MFLYYSKYSSNCRAVLLVAKELGLEPELKYINLYREENLTEEFLKNNPTGQVPALVDKSSGVCVYDSHAIAIYLAQKYGKDKSTLYPRDFSKRTVVLERLFFEASYLFARLFEICDPLINGRETTISQEKIKRVVRGYETVERFFSGNSFVAGDCLTIADFSTWSSLLVLDLLIPIDAESFPKLKAYMTRFEAHPNYNLNIEGAKKQVDLIDKFMEKAKSYHINSFELIYPKPV